MKQQSSRRTVKLWRQNVADIIGIVDI